VQLPLFLAIGGSGSSTDKARCLLRGTHYVTKALPQKCRAAAGRGFLKNGSIARRP